jgi:hypothetical protein
MTDHTRVPRCVEGRPMRSRQLQLTALIASAWLFLGTASRADVTAPGSLLVFPRWDNTPGTLTLLTVTNTNQNLATGAVDVEFDYIDGQTCQEFNRTRTLTPSDELTVATFVDNPNLSQGYAFVFAKSHATGKAIKFDWLIGTSVIITSHVGSAFELSPFVFKAGAALAEGAVTDLNNNGLRDLNGLEYEPVPDLLEFPSFFGLNSSFSDEIILIDLTGGAQFSTLVDFLVYNDNEEQFSTQFSFTCWIDINLGVISPLFTDAFLKTTNNSQSEVAGVPAAPELGWFQVNGDVAISPATQFLDPAILAVRVTCLRNGVLMPNTTQVSSRSFCATLPFGLGTQTNGSLLSHNLLGN